MSLPSNNICPKPPPSSVHLGKVLLQWCLYVYYSLLLIRDLQFFFPFLWNEKIFKSNSILSFDTNGNTFDDFFSNITFISCFGYILIFSLFAVYETKTISFALSKNILRRSLISVWSVFFKAILNFICRHETVSNFVKWPF